MEDSDDNTPSIIRRYSREFSNICPIRFSKHMGYSPSLIAGCEAAENEITVFAEAGSFLNEQAITHLVSNFRNPDIGVVTGKDLILNVNNPHRIRHPILAGRESVGTSKNVKIEGVEELARFSDVFPKENYFVFNLLWRLKLMALCAYLKSTGDTRPPVLDHRVGRLSGPCHETAWI